MPQTQESYPLATTGVGVAAQILSAGNANRVVGKNLVPGYNDVVLSLSGANGPTTFQLNPEVTDVKGTPVSLGTSYVLASVAASSGPGILVASAVATSSGSVAVYTVASGGTTNQWVGFSFTVAGFQNAQNNGLFVCTASSSTSLTLANFNAVAETHAATASSDEGVAVYTGTFTGETTGSLVGKTFVVSGFVTNPSNNGTFVATANSGTTTLTLANPDAVAETHAATAVAQEISWTAAITSVASSTGVYTGTFTQFASYVPGMKVTITGFVTNAANNGTFTVVSATATTLTTSNTASVSESASASAVINPSNKLTYVVYPAKTNPNGTYLPVGRNNGVAVATVSSTGLLTATALGNTVVEVSFPFANNTAGVTGAISPNPMTGLPAQKVYAEQRVIVKA